MASLSTDKHEEPDFKPAKPSSVVIDVARKVVRVQLSLSNKLHVSEASLDNLRGITEGAGIILVSNHADETDPRLCLELSRRCKKRFISMCNREAFDELSGFAGWALSKLGHFSVQRGAHDSRAKQYAIDVVREGKSVLLIFPEGEIFYLNEEIQPFHSGAVEICMQAILQQRKVDPGFKAFIVPMAIKYHHHGSIKEALALRISKMESSLDLVSCEDQSYSSRLKKIQAVLLEKEVLDHGVLLSSDQDLFEEIEATESSILAKVEGHHHDVRLTQNSVIDQSWQLSAEIRKEIKSADTGDSAGNERLPETKEELIQELEDLKEVAHLTSWRPQYYEGTVSYDRLAEVVLKLERELYNLKRPRQLTQRDAYINISEPIDLSQYIEAYQTDAHAFRHDFTKRLQDDVQSQVDDLFELTSKKS